MKLWNYTANVPPQTDGRSCLLAEPVKDVVCFNLDWSEFAMTQASDIFDGTIEEVPFDWDDDLIAELEEASSSRD